MSDPYALLMADEAARRWAGDDARRAAAGAALALAADPGEALGRLAGHAGALEALPPGALHDAVRLATLSPALLRWLAGHGALAALPAARRDAAARIDPAIADASALARAHDLGLTAILLAEDYGQLDTAAGGERLSALADALAGAAFAADGNADGEPLRVLAMGKWAGGELNFHSDLDLQLTGPAHARPAALTGLRALRTLGGPVERLRCDLNLRPRGRDGELLIPRAALLNYLGHWAQPWEIVAGLRVRELGDPRDEAWRARREEWFALLWKRRPAPALLRHTLSEFKGRLEEKGGGAGSPRDLKLGPGGIREIEFLAQGLLLIEGEPEDLAIAGNTWRALRRLEVIGALHSHELQLLLTTYARLRRLENLLQAEELLAVHELPASLPAMARLLAAAREPGPPEASPFLDELEASRQAVRDLFALRFRAGGRLLFSGAGEGSPWAPLPVPEDQRAGLTRAWRRALGATGEMPAAEATELELRIAGAVAERPAGAPRWLDLLDALADRGLGLAPLARRPAAIEPLGPLLAAAPAAADWLIRRPALFDELEFGADPSRLPERVAALLAAHADDPASAHLAASLARFALAGAVIAGGHPAAQAATLLAACDRALLAGEWPACGEPGLLAVALGGLGGGGLTPGGDWDLVFVARDGGRPPPRRLLERHAAHTAWGKLPALDLDLRPWGRDGEPVVSFAVLADYLAAKAEPYERLSWLRARAVAGDPALADELECALLAPLRAWRPEEAEARAIWRRVGQRSGRDFKTADGGPLQTLAGRQLAGLLGDEARAAALAECEAFLLGLRFALEIRGLAPPAATDDEGWRALAARAGAPLIAEWPARRDASLALLAPWREALAAGKAEASHSARPARPAVE